MGLGQYNSLGEYCGPHTASSVFLILLLPIGSEKEVLGLGVFPLQYFPLLKTIALYLHRYEYNWVVKTPHCPQRQYSGHNTHLGHNTDRGPMGLGQYNRLGEYCGPHTASSVFLILI